MDEISTIDRDDLKAKLDAGADIKLVMSLQRWAFEALHIPGSLHFDTPEQLLSVLDRDDEVIVYCSDPACVGSRFAYKKLVENGFTNVRRYAGGLSDWQAAGFPLEGTAAR
jgi:rhodanese-related sulfurtransferase